MTKKSAGTFAPAGFYPVWRLSYRVFGICVDAVAGGDPGSTTTRVPTLTRL